MAKAQTIDDFLKTNTGYKKTWDPNTNTATLTNSANNKSINFGINQGNQYGLGSVDNETGSHVITDVNKFVASLNDVAQPATQATPITPNTDLSGLNNLNLSTPATKSTEYKSPYEEQINSAINRYLYAPSFSYNRETDPSFKAYEQQYTKAGEEALQNTLGDLTTMTGGRLNTWATSAASQAKNKYMQDLNNIIPTLEQNAYAKYQNEYTQLANKLKELQGLDTASYNRNRDTISDTQRADDKAKQEFINTMGQYSGDFQARINELGNDNDPSNDWQIPYLSTARQDKIQKKEATDKQNFLDTIGQYSNDYQERINQVTSDNDPTNDYEAPYLKVARQQKIQAQATAEAKAAESRTATQQKAYENALNLWKTGGVATPSISAILGVPEGAVTSDYDIASINASISKANAETSRMNANTGAYEAQTGRNNSDNSREQDTLKASTAKITQYKNQLDQLYSTPLYNEDGKQIGANVDYAKIKTYLQNANKSGALSDPEAKQILSLYGFSY